MYTPYAYVRGVRCQGDSVPGRFEGKKKNARAMADDGDMRNRRAGVPNMYTPYMYIRTCIHTYICTYVYGRTRTNGVSGARRSVLRTLAHLIDFAEGEKRRDAEVSTCGADEETDAVRSRKRAAVGIRDGRENATCRCQRFANVARRRVSTRRRGGVLEDPRIPGGAARACSCVDIYICI